MRWFGMFLVGLVTLTSACGGGTSDENAPEKGTATDPIRAALEDQLEAGLLRDLPRLEEEEAGCISEAVLSELPDFDTALEDPEMFAEELLARTRAAQERCLTPDRIAELTGDEAADLAREPAEEAYLLVVRGVAGGLDTEDQELVDAGYLVCGLAEEAGSLATLVALLAATPEASARAAADLSPLVGTVLRAEELITFSTIAVVALCPEVDDR